MWLPYMHSAPPKVVLESWRSPASQSLETIPNDINVLSFPHDILSVFTREMKVRDETRQTFVTGSGPLCDRTCKFVD